MKDACVGERMRVRGKRIMSECVRLESVDQISKDGESECVCCLCELWVCVRAC